MLAAVDGSERRFDSPLDRRGVENLVVEPTAKPLELMDEARESGAPRGRYRLTISALDPQHDALRIDAERADAVASELYAQGGVEHYQQPLAELDAAQQRWLLLDPQHRCSLSGAKMAS